MGASHFSAGGELVEQRHHQPLTEVEPMTVPVALDSAGRRRSPATLPGFHSGRAPRNKGMLYPADPPTVEEIVCVMRHASEDLTASGCER